MEGTQSNTAPSSTNIDLVPKSSGSSEVKQKLLTFGKYAFYASAWYFGLPAPFIPLIEHGSNLAVAIAYECDVPAKVGQIGSQIGSTATDAFSWTTSTVSSAARRTTQVASNTYNYTKEKTSQGINYTKERMPSLSWKNNPNYYVTPKLLPGSSYGIAHFGNSFNRSFISGRSTDEKHVKL
eukprot:TRINITY_DN6351_c0_g1_i1.p1 TRINITY_DN6351_c0_g1~~TRINITY_DN6351_c0_g1_i1.p1  ORF type:complete len:181 (+),score=5.56 TRINITY_DN6351_c0_g1_i1:87-629(+)